VTEEMMHHCVVPICMPLMAGMIINIRPNKASHRKLKMMVMILLSVDTFYMEEK
jgi:hypothetical protein